MNAVCKLGGLAALGWLMLGCQSTTGPENEVEVSCQEPRPEVCTFDYRPVCGLDGRGQWQTHGNACSACANPNVIGYKAGACDTGMQ